MKAIGVDLQPVLRDTFTNALVLGKKEDWHPFVGNFVKLWDDNGDMISKQYAGTGSSDGGASLMGVFDKGVKAIGRFYMNNFEDTVRQECIQALAGVQSDTVSSLVEDELVGCEADYCTFEDMSIFVATYNIAANEVTAFPDISPLIKLDGEAQPNLFVFGFQEIVDLNPQNMLAGNNDLVCAAWVQYMTMALNSPATFPGAKLPAKSYQVVCSHSLVGLFIMVFASTDFIPRISKLSLDIVKTGVAGTVGNKGAVIAKLYVDDTSIVFINCHLEAGQHAITERLRNLNDIHNNAFQQVKLGKKVEERIERYDYRILLGDFNSRTNLAFQDALTQLAALQKEKTETGVDKIHEFFKFDQLASARSDSEFLRQYQEGEIKFWPTYKYDMGTNNFDTSKKERTPSYCDRIMIWPLKRQPVKQVFYDRRELVQSDHKPVVAYYMVKVKKMDKGKRDDLIKSIYKRRKTHTEETKKDA